MHVQRAFSITLFIPRNPREGFGFDENVTPRQADSSQKFIRGSRTLLPEVPQTLPVSFSGSRSLNG
jgi:hypothetical protein